MRPPNTAPLGCSVWDRIGRKTFEERVNALSQTKFVPRSSVLLERNWPGNRPEDVFPFATEKQFCDDIAYIAACEYGVKYVTVATVEPARGHSGGLVLRLAANEGVCARVKEGIGEILRVLERCAQKRLSRDQCSDEAFDIIVKLNKNRILGRLASKFFKRPSHETGPRRLPLTRRLKQYTAAHKPTRSRHDFDTLRDQIDAFHASFLHLEQSTHHAIVDATKIAVKDAFSITLDGFSLPGRLENMGFGRSVTDTREIHEVNKVANYWRICRDLAYLSRCYRTLFTELRLEALEPYGRSPTIDMKLNKFVHAEIQMVVFCETSVTPPWPRPIGASKEACFLCDSFIKAHGHFYLSKAHRQIFPQWTLPDLKEYSTATLERFRGALAAVAQNVTQELEKAKRNRQFQPFPRQSSINLHKLVFPTPSLTTVHSSSSETIRIVSPVGQDTLQEPAVSEADIRSDGNTPVAGVDSPNETAKCLSTDLAPAPARAVECIPETETPEITNRQVKVSGLTAGSPTPTRSSSSTHPAITFTPTFNATIDWVNLHVELEDHSQTNSQDHGTLPMFPSASVGLKSLPYRNAINPDHETNCINIGDLLPGEERVLARVEGDDHDTVDPEMKIYLMNEHHNPVEMICRWHRLQSNS